MHPDPASDDVTGWALIVDPDGFAIGTDIDPGIKPFVEILQAGGVETLESCQSGPGHSMPEPTIIFAGGPEAGWRALAVAMENGLPVLALRRSWMVVRGEVTGPQWEMTFRSLDRA